MRILIITLLAVLSCLPSVANAAQEAKSTLQGLIFLKDSISGGAATVYMPELKMSAITRIDGSYEINNIPEGRYAVRYSFIGYKTITDTITFNQGSKLTRNVTLEEYSIPLSTVYITPGNQDPAVYILNKMWATAKNNKSRLKEYSVVKDATFSIRNAHMISEMMDLLLSGFQKWAVKSAMSLIGMKKVFELFVKYPELKFRMTVPCQYKNGKFTEGTWKIDSQQLTEEDKQTLRKVCNVSESFNLVYGNDCLWSQKKAKKQEWKFEGSYDEGDKMIDKLSCTKKDVKYTLHIVDDEWGIIKIEKKSKSGYSATDCQEVAKGLYLPVSARNQLSSEILDAKEFEKTREYLNNPDKKAEGEDQELFERLKKKMSKDPELAARVNKILNSWESNGLRLEMMASSTARYSKVTMTSANSK